MHSVELDAPTPRPVRCRWVGQTWNSNFDPWLTWKIGLQFLCGGALAGAFGWLVNLRFFPFGAAFLIFGGLCGGFGVLCALSGLFIANEEVRGHRFLVEQGVVAKARVVRWEKAEDMRHDYLFEFQDAQNRIRRGRCSTLRGDEWFNKLPFGGEFDVLYSPRNSRHFVPYPIAIYEVAP